MKHFIDTSPLSLPTISIQQNSFDPLPYQFGEGDALIGTFSTLKVWDNKDTAQLGHMETW